MGGVQFQTLFTQKLSKILALQRIVFDEDNHFHCFVHIINLVAQATLKSLTSSLV